MKLILSQIRTILIVLHSDPVLEVHVSIYKTREFLVMQIIGYVEICFVSKILLLTTLSLFGFDLSLFHQLSISKSSLWIIVKGFIYRNVTELCVQFLQRTRSSLNNLKRYGGGKYKWRDNLRWVDVKDS